MQISSRSRPLAFITDMAVFSCNRARAFVRAHKTPPATAVPNAHLARDAGLDPKDLPQLHPHWRSADWHHPRL